MASIYDAKKALIEKYTDTLALIEKANPKKEDGSTPYDMSITFEMLKADYKATVGGQELPYAFEGSDSFDWQKFGEELKAI